MKTRVPRLARGDHVRAAAITTPLVRRAEYEALHCGSATRRRRARCRAMPEASLPQYLSRALAPCDTMMTVRCQFDNTRSGHEIAVAAAVKTSGLVAGPLDNIHQPKH